MSGSCCARLQRANVEFAAVERPREQSCQNPSKSLAPWPERLHMRPVLHTQKHGWRLRCAASLLRFARQPCFCVCSTGLMCSRTGHGASDLDEIWHDCSRRPFDGREPYVRAPQPRAAAVRHSRAPRRQKLWLSMVQMRDGAPRSARRKTSRCNFSRPCVFANFEAHGIVSREHRSPLKPSF